MRIYFLSLVILLGFIGCDKIMDPGDTTPLHKSITVDGIEYSAEIPSDKFSLYDTLFISFRVSNNSFLKKEFNFSNIQQLAFELVDRNYQRIMYYPYIVLPALSNFSVSPGETKELSVYSALRDYNGRYLDRGKYTLYVYLANNNSPRLRLNVSIY